jgi:hypothetical protein
MPAPDSAAIAAIGGDHPASSTRPVATHGAVAVRLGAVDPRALSAAQEQLGLVADLLRDPARPADDAHLSIALSELASLAPKAGVTIDDLREPATGRNVAMIAAGLGDASAYRRILDLGSDPRSDRNPLTQQTHAHYAALAVSSGSEVLKAMEEGLATRLGSPQSGIKAMVELANTHNALSAHDVCTDLVFYRNSAGLRYLLDLRQRAQGLGAVVDITSPTARGIRNYDLMQRSPGSFDAAVLAMPEFRDAPVRGPDGKDYPNAPEYEKAMHTAWAEANGLPAANVLALISAAQQHKFPEAMEQLATLQKAGLGGGANAKIGFLGQTLLFFNVMGPKPDAGARRAAIEFQRRALEAGVDPQVREDKLMAVSPFIRAAALGKAGDPDELTLTLDLARWVQAHRPADLAAYVNAQGLNNGRTALLDALFAGNWDLARALRDLGADPSLVGYDGIPALALAQTFAKANGTQVPQDLAAWIGSPKS